MVKPSDLMPIIAERLDVEENGNPPTNVAFPLNPCNLPSVYPQEQWDNLCYSNSFQARSHVPALTHIPNPNCRMKNKMDCSFLCHAIAFLLILFSLMGVGLGMYKILQLQQDLARLKKSTSDGQFIPILKKQIGDWSAEAGKNGNENAAHLTGNNDIHSLPLMFQNSGWGAFTTGVQYRNQGLAIEKDGLYFIYSEVNFAGEGCKSEYLKHVVYKRTPRYRGDLVLMETRMVTDCRRSNEWSRSSYLGAVFNLSTDDKLYVNVSDVTHVVFEGSKTFFGLHKL